MCWCHRSIPGRSSIATGAKRRKCPWARAVATVHWTVAARIIKKKTAHFRVRSVLALPIFPGSRPPSIVGANELNFCVRNGERWERRLWRMQRGRSVGRGRCATTAFAPRSAPGHPNRKQVDNPLFPSKYVKLHYRSSGASCVRVTYLPGQSPAKYCRRTCA